MRVLIASTSWSVSIRSCLRAASVAMRSSRRAARTARRSEVAYSRVAPYASGRPITCTQDPLDLGARDMLELLRDALEYLMRPIKHYDQGEPKRRHP